MGADRERSLGSRDPPVDLDNGIVRIVFVAFHGSVHTRRWVSFYAARGHEAHVVTCGGAGVPPDGPYAVHDLGAPRLGKAGYLARLPRARRVLRRLRPDVVHAHWATSYGLLAVAAGVHPLVVTAHGDDVLIAPRSRLLRPVVRRVLRAADLVTVPSEQMREAVHALAGPGVDVETVQYGVETGRLEALARRARAARPAGAPVTLISARPMLALYRLDVVLDALALLRERGLDWRLLLYGDGPERRTLERRAQALGLSGHVEFRGHRAAADVEGALAAADLYVSVAESDGASIALLEALALGPVPVLSDIPANRAWVRDGGNGALTAIEPRALADALVRAHGLDSGAVAAENLRIVSERADLTRNLAALESRLEALVASAGRA